MGRFGNKVSQETKKRSSTIQVNKFEIAENALKIIAKICTPQNDNFVGDCFDEFWNIMFEKQNVPVLLDEDFNYLDFADYQTRDSLFNNFRDIKIDLSAHENTNDTQVVVAGAFSSGKSTFLNSIIGFDNLLPNGVDPVSVVNTFIYCSNKTNDISVKGVNLKNALVQLDRDILQCIQHSSKSNVYLASVLDKLFVEVPANNLTKGLAFIDTPGYNKSDSANESNGKTDQDTAMEAFDKGNVLFWVVDIDDGNIVDTSKNMINSFLEKHDNKAKVVVVLNKADKKRSDIEMIAESISNTLKVKNNNNFLDIIAYSSDEKKMYYSYRGNSFEGLFDKVRAAGTGYSAVSNTLRDIANAFQEEIDNHEAELKEAEEHLQEAKNRKNKDYQTIREIREDFAKIKENCEFIAIESYNQVLNWGSIFLELVQKYRKVFCDYWNATQKYGSAQWGEGDNWDWAVKHYSDEDDAIWAQFQKTDTTYHNEEWRENVVSEICSKLDNLLDIYDDEYKEDCNRVDYYIDRVKREKEFVRLWKYYRDRFISALNTGIERYSREKGRFINDAKLEQKYNVNVFDAIASNNYSDFENCFTNGVSLMDYNSEGYSALTYAVMYGANDMVQFMIDHNADLSVCDKRGYNAFHTAVENNYKDMCQMLLDADPTLATKKSANGESIMEIANKNMFIKWLEKKI